MGSGVGGRGVKCLSLNQNSHAVILNSLDFYLSDMDMISVEDNFATTGEH
jgi:hypothetical protein